VGQGPGIPLLVLHGGPGIPSAYLEPLGELGRERPVVFYDQLGCGHSPAEDDPKLWTVPRFVDEVSRVREALGLRKVHILGHSWGAMVATDYMLTRPEGVTSLVLAGPCLSAPRWSEDTRKLLLTLPASTRKIIVDHESAGTTESPEYQEAVMEFYRLHVARRQPWAEYLTRALETMNPAIYGYMWGPSEFTPTGILRTYDRTGRLGEIGVPTLVVSGQHDEILPETALEYHRLIPGAELAIVPGAAHIAWHDDRDAFLAVVRGFLDRVETR
jgi:proline iminopeptidase